MANNTFLGTFVQNYAQLVEPLRFALKSERDLKKLMYELGWAIPSPPVAEAQQIVTSIESLIASIQALPPNPAESDMINILSDILAVFNTIKTFANTIAGTTTGISPLQTVFKAEFPKDLFNYLICQYLNAKFKVIFNFLKAFKIIEYINIPATSPRPAFIKIKINYNNFSQLINNPLLILKQKLNWNSTEFDINEVLDEMSDFLASLNFNTSLNNSQGVQKYLTYNHPFDTEDILSETLSVKLMDVLVGTEYHRLGLNILGSLGTTLADTGLIIGLDVPSGVALEQEITDNLKLKINLSSVVGQSFAFLIKPSGLDFKYLSSNTIPSSSLELRFLYSPDEPTLIFGQPEGTRLQLEQSDITLQTNYAGTLEFAVDFDLSGLNLIIDPGDADSFISKIFGSTPKEINFPLAVRWSSKDGISFKGSGSFEYNVNTHYQLGPLEFNDIKIALRAPQGQNKVTVEVGTNIKGDLGPVSFNVDNIGLGLTLGLTEGNAGPFDIRIGFKPPTGAGFSIDADPVTGGGFLKHDAPTSTYTGGLELNFSKISFSALGIISTKLPGGLDGYSLLVIITAEFGPIPLGMGFSLNGLGGLMGLHRTMNPDVLRTGIRDNTLDNILFPKDIVKNADTIISNMGQAFPILQDQFVVGPMAKIGWGTPTIITVDLGIIIELPDPVRLAILGVVKAILPSEQNAIVRIQVNFLGIIDFTNKYLSLDASIYDSKIFTFGLFGDMALRLYWGEKPAFLLSVGGFHPKFTPPPMNLPDMRRLSVIIVNEENLKVGLEAYFAITSNSVQFGAKVAAMARAGKVSAVGALWFDILFQFRPFYFIADMGVMFAIKWGEKTLLAVFINLSLEGPNPWRAKGIGTFKILGFKVSVSFDKTFGKSRLEAVEAEAIDAKLKEALQHKDNWEVILPERNQQQVAWRSEDVETTLSVDPGGALKISQRLIPFNIKLEKCGAAPISDFNRYNITGVDIGTKALPIQLVKDHFARNEFFFMPDQEKLSRDSYELFDSGVIAGNDDSLTSGYAVHKKIEYEQITIDYGYRRFGPRLAMNADLQAVHEFGNYISDSGGSSFNRISTSDGPSKVRVSLDDESFTLINRNTLALVSSSLSFSSSAEAEAYLAAQREISWATAGEWLVANKFELLAD